MSCVPGDLILLAAVARMYGVVDSSQDLYLLAQLGADTRIAPTIGDMEAGLSLLGMLSARIVAERVTIPPLVGKSLADGHAVIAQYRERLHPRAARWCALCEAMHITWRGLAVGSDFSCHSVGSDLGALLTGHYLIITRQLPEWDAASGLPVPPLN